MNNNEIIEAGIKFAKKLIEFVADCIADEKGIVDARVLAIALGTCYGCYIHEKDIAFRKELIMRLIGALEDSADLHISISTRQ